MKRGFTLIELLVVIAIIGILSSIVLGQVQEARRRAQYAKAKSEITQLMKVMMIVTGETGKVLGVERRPGRPPGITGSGSSSWLCRNIGDIRNLPEDHECRLRWYAALDKIAAASGGLVTDLSQFKKDPWGSPYLLDENEGESASNPCSPDWIGSAGPDGLGAGSWWGDNYIKVFPLYSQGCI